MNIIIKIKKGIKDRAIFLWQQEKLITIIFLCGLFLRLLGTYPGYPLSHPDEPSVYTSSVKMAFRLDFKPQTYYYGQLLPLLYGASYLIIFMPLTVLYFIVSNPISPDKWIYDTIDYIYNQAIKGLSITQLGPWGINYWARYDSAIIGALTIITAYLLGKRLFNKQIALLTSLFIAINYRHVLSSKLILADAQSAFFALLAVYIFTNIINKPILNNYLLAGIAMGLSFSVKFFIYIIPAFIICHLLANLKNNLSWKNKILNFLFSPKVIMSIILCLIIFIAINPYLILAKEEAVYYIHANSLRYGLSLSTSYFQPQSFSLYSIYYLYYFGLGPILSYLIIIGFVWSIIRYPKGTLIISSVALFYIYTFLIISGTGMVRNYAAIIPFVLFYPSILIRDFINILSKFIKLISNSQLFTSVLHKIIYLVVLLPIIFLPIKYSFLNGLSFARAQNMQSLYNWMKNNLAGVQVLNPSGIFFPSDRNLEGVTYTTNGNNFPSIQEIKDKKINWMIMTWIPYDVTENLLYNKNTLKNVFYNKSLLESITSNIYTVLAFKELADYRIVEFAKSFSQDPAFMMLKFPENWNINEDIKIQSFNFNSTDKLDDWIAESYPNNSYHFSLNQTGGIDESPGLEFIQNTPSCNSIYQKLSSPKIPVTKEVWYSLLGLGRRDFVESFKNIRNGFYRLDFFDQQDQLIKSYVSRPLSAISKWQELSAAGLAPINSNYARATFELDICLPEEKYTIDDITIYKAEETPKIPLGQYPFFNKKIPSGFEWIPQL